MAYVSIVRNLLLNVPLVSSKDAPIAAMISLVHRVIIVALHSVTIVTIHLSATVADLCFVLLVLNLIMLKLLFIVRGVVTFVIDALKVVVHAILCAMNR